MILQPDWLVNVAWRAGVVVSIPLPVIAFLIEVALEQELHEPEVFEICW